MKIEDLPKRVPLKYLTEKQASNLGYSKKQDIEYAASKLQNNQQMFVFSTSNIRREEDRKFLALRLEGFVLRMRYVVYQAMLVALCQTPIIVTLSIFILESCYLSVYLYYAIRYRYPKNWLLMASKLNVGLSIIYFSLLGLILSANQENSKEMSYVAAKLQGLGITIGVNCLLIETVLLIINLTTTAYEMYLDWKNQVPQQQIIPTYWVKENKVVDEFGEFERQNGIETPSPTRPLAEEHGLGNKLSSKLPLKKVAKRLRRSRQESLRKRKISIAKQKRVNKAR